MRTLTYHVESSLDGFIAAPDGSIDAVPVTTLPASPDPWVHVVADDPVERYPRTA
jgi:hypothetical protein